MWASNRHTGEMSIKSNGQDFSTLLAFFGNIAPLYVSQALAQGAVTVSAVMAGVMVNQMGHAAWVGLPNLCMSLASTVSAGIFGAMMISRGRRIGLLAAFTLGTFGTLLGFVAAYLGQLLLFLLATALVGAAQGGYYQARYAVAENVPEERRGSALGAFMLASVVGAVLTGWLLGPIGYLAEQLGTNAYIAGWLVGTVLLAASALLMVFWQPVPLDQSAAAATTTQKPEQANRANNKANKAKRPNTPNWRQTIQRSGIRSTILAMATSHGLMVSLMSLLPVRAAKMGVHHHGVEGMVVGHIVGMFGFGWLTGPLIDRLGVRLGYIGGALLLAASALVAPLQPQQPSITVSMFLLGLGWNLVAVSGSKVLSRHPAAQSLADSLSYFVAGVGSVLAGWLMHGAGFQWLAWVCAALSLLPLISAARVNQIDKPQPARRRLVPKFIKPTKKRS